MGTAAVGAFVFAVFAPATAGAQAPPPSAFPGEAPEGPPAIILEFRVEPSAIMPGQSAVVHWEVTNAYSLAITPDIGVVGTRGSQTVTPDATTTYELEAVGTGGTVNAETMLTVMGTEPREVGAATAEATGARPIPRLANGKPDLSGLYIGGRDVRLVGNIELTDAGKAARAAREANDLGQGVQCLPPGVPNATMMPFPLQIVQKPDVVVIMYEAYHLFRIIPVGRPHPEYMDPAWMGHSVASWDGDTLVVDVAGFNDRTLIGGNPHTADMHVTERYTRVSYDTIQYEAVVEDPANFAAPVRYAGPLSLRPEWEIGEYLCNENAKDYDALFDEDSEGQGEE